MAVLVTGGAGYVGAHLVIHLLEQGYDVVIVDNLSNSVKDDDGTNLPPSLKRVQIICKRPFKFFDVDIRNKERLTEILRQNNVKIVIHCAAYKSVGESCQNPLKYYNNNIGGAVSLLEAMRDSNVKTLVFSSSCTVYGDPQYFPIDEKHHRGIHCTNPYGRSKYACELLMEDVCFSDKEWTIVSLRYFNPVGSHHSGEVGDAPSDSPPQLVTAICKAANGLIPEVRVFGTDYDTKDGTAIRDYIHIDDLVDAHVKVMNMARDGKFTGFNAYNLGRGHGSTVKEVIETFKLVTGQKVAVKFEGRRQGDVPVAFADSRLAEKHLDWKANKDLKDMCKDAWKFARNYPNGYR